MTKITCESCGSSSVELNLDGVYICSHCGTQYAYSFSGNVCIKKDMSSADYLYYLKKIVKRLSEEERTPMDILEFKIVDKFKLITNNNIEYHFKYAYNQVNYQIIFDDLGIKKVEFPKNQTIVVKQSKNTKKFFQSFLIMIIASAIVTSFLDAFSMGFNLLISVGFILLILVYLGKMINANNKIIDEEMAYKQKKMLEFFVNNNLE